MKQLAIVVLAVALAGCGSLLKTPEPTVTERYDPNTGALVERTVPVSLMPQMQVNRLIEKQMDVQISKNQANEAAYIAVGSQPELSDVETVALLGTVDKDNLGGVLQSQESTKMVEASARVKGPVDIQIAKIERFTRIATHLLPRPVEMFNAWGRWKAIEEDGKSTRELYRSLAFLGKGDINIQNSSSGTAGGGEGSTTTGGDAIVLVDGIYATDSARVAESFYGPVRLASDSANVQDHATDPFNQPGLDCSESGCDGENGFFWKQDPTSVDATTDLLSGD
jgi:hypothetical protein